MRDNTQLLAVSRLAVVDYACKLVNAQSYLEVGYGNGRTWNGIHVPVKVGIDTRPNRGTFRGTSDEYFATHQDEFDAVFIDGNHAAGFVYRDTIHALHRLNPGGAIVLHDCNPACEADQARNGDAWRAFLHFRTQPDLDCACGDFSYGCGVIRVRPNTDPLTLPSWFMGLTWQEFEANRRRWLRLMTWPEIREWMSKRPEASGDSNRVEESNVK